MEGINVTKSDYKYESLSLFDSEEIDEIKFSFDYDVSEGDYTCRKLQDFIDVLIKFLETKSFDDEKGIRSLLFLNNKDFRDDIIPLNNYFSLYGRAGYKIFSLIVEIARKNNISLPKGDEDFLNTRKYIELVEEKISEILDKNVIYE